MPNLGLQYLWDVCVKGLYITFAVSLFTENCFYIHMNQVKKNKNENK